MIPRKGALRRMASNEVLARPAVLSTMAFGILFHLYGNSAGIKAGAATRVVVAAIAGLLMYTVLAVLWLGVQRLHGRTRTAAALIAYVIASAVRATSLQLLFIAFGMQQMNAPLLLQRLFSATIVMTMALMGSAYIVSVLGELRGQHEALELESQRLTAALADSTKITRARQSDAVARVRSIIDRHLTDLPTGSAAATLKSLATLADDVIRPMSHTLAESIPTWQPPDITSIKATWPGIVRKLSLEGALRPVLVTGVVIIMALPSVAALYGARGSLLLLVGSVFLPTMIVLVRGALSAAVDRLHPMPRVVGITAALVIVGGAMAVLVVLVLGEAGPASVYIGAALVQVPLVGWFAAFGSATAAELATTNARLVEVNADLAWTVARSRLVQWHQQRQLARALHGPLQAAVQAAMRRLSLVPDDTAVSDTVTNDVRVELQRTVAYVLTNVDADVDVLAEIDDLVSMWDGVASIEVTVSDDARAAFERDAACASIVGDIAQDAVSNAVRHGYADAIRVDIHMATPKTMAIIVENSGRQLDSSAQTGLGTIEMQECSLEWSRTPTTDGLRVTALLPLAVGLPSASRPASASKPA